MKFSPNPREFLFAIWEGGGNAPPTLEVARKLVERGHRVRWIGDACQEAESRQVGVEFLPWTDAPSRHTRHRDSDFLRDHEAADAPGQFALLRDRLMLGPALHYARDVARELDRRRADVLVSSEMLFGAMLAAEARDTPLVLLGANLSLFPIPGLPPAGSGLAPARTAEERARIAQFEAAGRALLNVGLSSLNAARRQFALAPIADVGQQAAVASRYLLLTSRAFDFQADSLPEHIRYVGPELKDPSWSAPWKSPWPTNDERPLVLVAFSTTFQNQLATVARTITALESLPVRATVTLGPALQDLPVSGAENIQVVASASHSDILGAAAAVITHAGHGTVMRALAAGVPLLCMPMGRDQNDNAVRVATRGAGLELSPAASVAQIRSAIQQLLGDSTYRRAAQTLGEAVLRDAAGSTVIEELEAAAAVSALKSRPVPVRDRSDAPCSTFS